MKNEMTSLDVAAIVHELDPILRDARIENIYQISPRTVLLKIHRFNKPTVQLLIEAGKRFHLTDYVQEKPAKPPVFCMTLRKYLNGGITESVYQHDFERTVTLNIRTKQSAMQLIVELFSDGNIILADSQGVIVIAMTYKKMRDRSILRNEPFQDAPSSGKNPIVLTRAQLEALKDYGKLEVVRGLARFLSLGGLYAEELLLRASLDKNIPCEQLTPRQIDAVYEELQTILSVIRDGKFDPVIVVSEKGDWVDATPIRLKRYEGLEFKRYDFFNQALDAYFAQTSSAARVSYAQQEYQKDVAKRERMLREQQKTVDDAKIAIEENKRMGDLIYSHLGEFQLLHKMISDARQAGESWEQMTQRLTRDKQTGQIPAIYFHSFNSNNLVLNVTIDDLVFPLQIKHSVQANAAEYYERMKKAERKLEGAEKALRETRREIEELKKKWAEKIVETQAETSPKQVKKDWYEKFRWFMSSDGFLVIGGRDATTNEILIKKHLEPHDIVFHADIVGAPFVIVRTEGKSPTAQVVHEAAQFAASYSRAWREMLSYVDVYWVHPDQISKSAPAGQYVGKGAFIIRGTKNYVRKNPLRVAIGVQKRDDQFQAIGGPPDAIRRHTDLYVEIVPGDEPSARLAKRLRHSLAERAESKTRESIQKISVEQIQRFIPSGKGTIVAGRE